MAMFTGSSERWRKALTELACFENVTNQRERKRIFEQISHLGSGPLQGQEERICSEFHDLARRLRISLNVQAELTLQTVAALGDLCEFLGRQLLIYDEASARVLVSLFLDSLPPYSEILNPSRVDLWVSVLNGLAAVLYQNGVHIICSRTDTKRLEALFSHLVDHNVHARIRCVLAQTCVNVTLPTQTGVDPEKFIIKLCMELLLKLLGSEKKAHSCITTAHMIMVSIKGISRMIERISSRNEFVCPNDLNDLLTQSINWSLFGLQGAQPLDKTIKRENLPADVIPEDRSPDHQRVKRKKPMTRRRFRPAETEDTLADMAEINERLPWLTVTSSSDSESDTNQDKDADTDARKLRQKRGCIRQAALLTLKIIVKNTGKRDLCHYWKSFLPSCIKTVDSIIEHELNQSNCGLIISILWDPAPKARNLAVEVLRHFIQHCKQFINKVCTVRRSGPNYISLGEAVNISIERLHHLLIYTLQKEQRMNFHSNQEVLLMNQLYNTLKATVEATNYTVFRTDLLKTVVVKILPLNRCAAQFAFLKSIANERTIPSQIRSLYSASWNEITEGENIPYYISDSLREVPWPIATANSLLWNSYGKDGSASYSGDQKNRVSIEEEAIDLLQSFATHHFYLLETNHIHLLDIVKIILNSEMQSAVIAAAFRLLQTINAQSKNWRVSHSLPSTKDTPVPLIAFHGLWTYLIDTILPRYLQHSTSANVLVVDPALEAMSHIEPEVFQHLPNRQQAWVMSVMPDMCDHTNFDIQTKAIHALGDLVLIKSLRQEEDFLHNVNNVLLRKTKEHRATIFGPSTNINGGKMRNDLIYGIACLADAMRSTMSERSPTVTTSFVYDIFSPQEISSFFELMHSVKDFYDNIAPTDRVKPQAIRAVGGFLQLAPPETPPIIISRLVSTLESAIRQKNAKLVWNGSKAAEYFFGNEETAWIDDRWSNTLFRALSSAMKNHKNNKVKISCLQALNSKKVLQEILKRPEHLVQIFHDCADLAEYVPQVVAGDNALDYQAKLRDLCCEMIAALARRDRKDHELSAMNIQQLQVIVNNRRKNLVPMFQDYVDFYTMNGLERLFRANSTDVDLFAPIIDDIKDANDNILNAPPPLDASSIPA